VKFDVFKARFWSRVRKGDGCWEWTGGHNPAGYGVVRIGSKVQKAHRVAWWLEHGTWPALLRHRCDNPGCVRTDHLDTGTHADNVRDMDERHRRPLGESVYNAKLTSAQVVEMRERRARGATYVELAEQFRVNAKTVWQACRMTRWKAVGNL
jgi:hypothetical protein